MRRMRRRAIVQEQRENVMSLREKRREQERMDEILEEEEAEDFV